MRLCKVLTAPRSKWLMPKLYCVMPPTISQKASHTIIIVPIASAVNPEMFINLSLLSG